MSFTATVFRVLIASPSDLAEERKVAIAAVYDWNAQHAEAEGTILLPVAWEIDSMPQSGVRPQDAINQQLVDRSDILVGMFWTRLGTSTGMAESGTVEEIDRFVADKKPALLYFSSRPIDPRMVDPEQQTRLRAFETSIEKTALVSSFDSPDGLPQLITRHLLSQVRLLKQIAKGAGSLTPATASAAAHKQQDDGEGHSQFVPNDTWDRDRFE